jgi:NADPH2:quinone reductase
MTDTMRAIVLDAPGPPDALTIRVLPVPKPRPGWVLIRVKAFGLNRSELHTRIGLASGVTFPRVLGIEAAGIVAQAPGEEFEVGQQVVAMMGGMGRTYDGGYAEYTCVPASQVIPFRSDLDWSVLGAVPEMLQTAHGSLTVGLNAESGQSILIRGGTSSIGMATAVLAKQRAMTVLSTTRSIGKTAALRDLGVDHVLIDDGEIAGQVRAILPDGVDAALELIGTPTLPDTLRATRVHGTACFAGMLANQRIVKDFYPIEYLPRGVRLSAYGGDASDLPAPVLQAFLDAVAAGSALVPIDRVYAFDQIAEAHAAMESGHTKENWSSRPSDQNGRPGLKIPATAAIDRTTLLRLYKRAYDSGVTERSAVLGQALHTLAASSIRRRNRTLGLTTAATLSTLERTGPRRLTDLAVNEEVTQPSMTVLVNQLVDMGLAERRRDAADARVVLVAITPAGRKYLRDIRRAGAAALTALIDKLPDGEAEALNRALPAINHLVELLADGPR